MNKEDLYMISFLFDNVFTFYERIKGTFCDILKTKFKHRGSGKIYKEITLL